MRIRKLGATSAFIAIALFSACGGSSTPKAAGGKCEEPGKTATGTPAPTRIVSLSPTATEMLFAIGACKQVVAVDDNSNYPAGVPTTKLSGFEPNAEAIAGYEPDLVVLDGNTGGIVDSLASLKIPTAVLPAAVTIDDSYAQIEQLGGLTGHIDQAAKVTASMKERIAALVEQVPKGAAGTTYYHELDDTYYSVTSKTFIGQVYGLVGLVNIADDADPDGFGYPQLSAEHIVESNPQLIFLADTNCCQQTPETVAARPGWDKIAAVTDGKVIAVGDDVASRWGPRIVDLLEQVVAVVKK